MFIVKYPEQVLARKILKDEVDVLFISESFNQLDCEIYWCVGRLSFTKHVQHLLLILNMFNPLRFINTCLRNNLQRTQITVVDNQVHRAIFTLTNLDIWILI